MDTEYICRKTSEQLEAILLSNWARNEQTQNSQEALNQSEERDTEQHEQPPTGDIQEGIAASRMVYSEFPINTLTAKGGRFSNTIVVLA